MRSVLNPLLVRRYEQRLAFERSYELSQFAVEVWELHLKMNELKFNDGDLVLWENDSCLLRNP